MQDELRLPRAWYPKLGIVEDGELFLASMGIYVFSRDVLVRLLDNELHDFGKDIIPFALKRNRVHAYVYQGAWEDIGTIRAFFEANLDLTSAHPRFDFFDMSAPVFTRARFLPPTLVEVTVMRDPKPPAPNPSASTLTYIVAGPCPTSGPM